MTLSKTLLVVPCVAALALTSCVLPGSPFDVLFPQVGVYRTPVPDSYYYGGRYYSGGRYEDGRYYYRGRPYSNRYYHHGRYYYGGSRYYNQDQYRQAPSSRYY